MSFKSKLSEFRNSVFRKTPKAINAVPDIIEALGARIEELQNLVNALSYTGSSLIDARSRVDSTGGALHLPFSGPYDFKRDTINQDYVLQMNGATTAIRFEARAGSGNSGGAGTDRAELVADYSATDHHNTVPWGQECWSAFSTRIERDISTNQSDFLLFWQMHGVQEPGEYSASPPLALNFSGKSFRVTTRWDANAVQTSSSDYHVTSYAYDENFAIGKWDNWVIRMKFGYANDAILQVWRNGNLIVDKTTNFNMGFNDTYGPRPQFGIYRSQNYAGNTVVYHANTEFSYSSLADRITAPRPIPSGVPLLSDTLPLVANVTNITLPVISGSPILGQTLTASAGTWNGNPTVYTFQWKANGVNITGATGTTFVITSAQVGQTITVTVGASNGTTSGSASSAQTGTVIDGSAATQLRQQIVDRSALTQATTNVANTNNYTQIGDQLQLMMMNDDTELVVTDGNFFASTYNSTDMKGSSNVTFRRSVYDGTSYYPLTYNGQRDMTLAPGQTASWDPLTFSSRKGQGVILTSLKTWATAPTSFPGSTVPFSGARDLSEAGSSLTDRTTSGGFTASARVSTAAILPPISIKGAVRAKNVVVAVLGDSISSAGASDADTNRGQRGYVARALFAANIPFVTCGQSSLRALDVIANSTVTAQYLAPAIAAGVTHIYLALGTNDLNVPRSATQIYADIQTITSAAKAAIPGVKVIVATLPPRTNSANNSYQGSETNTFAQRAALNSTIRSNNGIGDGYFDVAQYTQSTTDTNLWRTDLLVASTIAIANGGLQNTSGDLVETNLGIVVQTGGSNGQPATAASIRNGQGGAFISAPTSPAIEETRQNASLTIFPATVGSGLQLNVTATAAAAMTTDGIHPPPAAHSFLKQALRDATPALFTL